MTPAARRRANAAVSEPSPAPDRSKPAGAKRSTSSCRFRRICRPTLPLERVRAIAHSTSAGTVNSEPSAATMRLSRAGVVGVGQVVDQPQRAVGRLVEGQQQRGEKLVVVERAVGVGAVRAQGVEVVLEEVDELGADEPPVDPRGGGGGGGGGVRAGV